MRIFLTIESQSTWGVKDSKTWLRNLYEPLIELGHDVYLLRSDLAMIEAKKKYGKKNFKQKFGEKLLKTFKRENEKPFGLFFSYLMDHHIDGEIIDEIKLQGIPTCNFSCNNIHQFYLVENISKHFDYNLHAEKYAAEKFKQIGANAVWFPMAANPQYYKPYDIHRTIDVSFVGQNYARRPYYIWHLLENGIDVQVYGPGWRNKEKLASLRKIKREFVRSKDIIGSIFSFSPERRAKVSSRIADMDFKVKLLAKYDRNLHFPISDDDMIRKYSESNISLGFMEVYDEHDHSKAVTQRLNLREFEAPMSGALYFTNYSDELTEFYEPDKEVIVYRNEHELLDKVRYYLSHPDKVAKVRNAGQRRALECHTYQRRFSELFERLNFN